MAMQGTRFGLATRSRASGSAAQARALGIAATRAGAEVDRLHTEAAVKTLAERHGVSPAAAGGGVRAMAAKIATASATSLHGDASDPHGSPALDAAVVSVLDLHGQIKKQATEAAVAAAESAARGGERVWLAVITGTGSHSRPGHGASLLDVVAQALSDHGWLAIHGSAIGPRGTGGCIMVPLWLGWVD
jgi:hypothetical protein